MIVILDSVLVAKEDEIADKDVAVLVGVAVVTLVLITTIVALQRQPSSAKRISFQVSLAVIHLMIG